MSCVLDNYSTPIGYNCQHLGEEKIVVRFVFIEPAFWQTIVASSTNPVFDMNTEDKKKNAVIAEQLALQASDATEPARITITGTIDNFAIAAPEQAEFSVSPKIVAPEAVVTGSTMTFEDMEAYSAANTLAGAIGTPSNLDSIFSDAIETTSPIAQHINAAALRRASGSYLVAYTDMQGRLFPFRDVNSDPVFLSISNYAGLKAIGNKSYTNYFYTIKGVNVGDFFSDNTIAYTDLSVGQTTPGTSDQYLKLLYKP